MRIINTNKHQTIWDCYIKVRSDHPILDEKHNETLRKTYAQKLEQTIKRAEEIKKYKDQPKKKITSSGGGEEEEEKEKSKLVE